MGSLLSPLLPTAFSTTGASSANRFVSIGPRDGNFLNIPQQSQVGSPACPGCAAGSGGNRAGSPEVVEEARVLELTGEAIELQGPAVGLPESPPQAAPRLPANQLIG